MSETIVHLGLSYHPEQTSGGNLYLPGPAKPSVNERGIEVVTSLDDAYRLIGGTYGLGSITAEDLGSEFEAADQVSRPDVVDGERNSSSENSLNIIGTMKANHSVLRKMFDPSNILDLKASYDAKVSELRSERDLAIDKRKPSTKEEVVSKDLKDQMVDSYIQIGAAKYIHIGLEGNIPGKVEKSIKDHVKSLMDLSYEELEGRTDRLALAGEQGPIITNLEVAPVPSTDTEPAPEAGIDTIPVNAMEPVMEEPRTHDATEPVTEKIQPIADELDEVLKEFASSASVGDLPAKTLLKLSETRSTPDNTLARNYAIQAYVRLLNHEKEREVLPEGLVTAARQAAIRSQMSGTISEREIDLWIQRAYRDLPDGELGQREAIAVHLLEGRILDLRLVNARLDAKKLEDYEVIMARARSTYEEGNRIAKAQHVRFGDWDNFGSMLARNWAAHESAFGDNTTAAKVAIGGLWRAIRSKDKEASFVGNVNAKTVQVLGIIAAGMLVVSKPALSRNSRVQNLRMHGAHYIFN